MFYVSENHLKAEKDNYAAMDKSSFDERAEKLCNLINKQSGVCTIFSCFGRPEVEPDVSDHFYVSMVVDGKEGEVYVQKLFKQWEERVRRRTWVEDSDAATAEQVVLTIGKLSNPQSTLYSASRWVYTLETWIKAGDVGDRDLVRDQLIYAAEFLDTFAQL